MPEGPEVKIITEWLRKQCKNKYMVSIYVDENSKYYERELEGYTMIMNKLPLYIENVTCKGKQIFFILTANDGIKYYMNSTLGMEGNWRLERKWIESSGKTHSNLWINIYDDNKNIFKLYYDDVRHGGNLRFLNENDYNNKISKGIGPDLLSEKIEWNVYYDRIKDIMSRVRKLTLDNFLLEQKYFSGIGNYLKSDILYLAGIDPHKKLFDLNDKEIYNMYYYSILIIKQSYDNGGMTIKSFVNPNNKSIGGYIPYVYGESCDRNGYVIHKTNGINKKHRTTYWVHELQK